MKPGKPGARRKRIILYYFAGVVLPGIILGYMAFRGMRNDQAIREQDNLKKLEANSQIFFSELDADLRRFTDEQTSESIIYGTKKFDPSILIIFVKDSTGAKKLISHQLLYPPEELLPGKPDGSNPSSILKNGQRLEFAEQRYSEALGLYQDIILKTTDPEEKKAALVASARLNKRINQPEKAKATYEMILKEYEGSLLNEQIPLALMAGLEIMKINRALNEKDELRANLQISLELLLHPVCEYDADQFEMFFQSFKEISNEPNETIDSLFTKLETERARTEYLNWFLGEPNLIETSGNNHYGSIKNTIYGIPVNSGELQAMFFKTENNNGIQAGMVIDFQVFVSSVWERLIRTIDPDSSINAKIVDVNGDPVFSRVIAEETEYLSFPFPENLPEWKLLLSENRPGFISTLMKAGSGIYLFAFILIVLLMLLGFVFIMYTLTVELRLNMLKSEFISNVSHELKSPLTSIHMMTEMLYHNRVRNEDRKAEYYAAMLEESDHLSHLIDNILDFSRIDEDRKKYEFTDLDPDKLTREFLKSIREMIRENGFVINYNCPIKVPDIRADRNAILQVLYNLVDNAIKFSHRSRKVDINLACKNNKIELSVKDYGIGIFLNEQEKIFERFYRSRESQKSGIRGSGIGLTIVKKIVEDHGGQLTLESMPGEGSEFTVRLPIADENLKK
jgi:signal transduction histidine kinase